MKTYLVSFADIRFRAAQARLRRSALKYGVDEFSAHHPRDLRKTEFFKKNRKILEMQRGAGYWLWKPYIILDVLSRVPNGTVVVYSDSGIEVTANLSPLINICQEGAGILLFNNCDYKCGHWTKRDCFILMDCDRPSYWEAPHLLGSFLLCRKNPESLEFVQEWLRYCSDERILTDLPNTLGKENLPGFVDHRHDQAVLSLLAARKGIDVCRDPTQWGNYLKDDSFRIQGEFVHREYSLEPYRKSAYGTLLYHHRMASRGPVVRTVLMLAEVRMRITAFINGSR